MQTQNKIIGYLITKKLTESFKMKLSFKIFFLYKNKKKLSDFIFK